MQRHTKICSEVIATEEMGHVELVANTINVLLEGASTPSENPEELPLSVALESPNISSFLSSRTKFETG